MSNRLFTIVVVLILLATCAYPIYQLWQTDGLLFYTNAHDETSYLQYDFSKASQGPTRVSQCLVTALHEVGLSGGGINLLFDMLAIPVFLLFAAKSFRLLNFDEHKANLCAFVMVFLPLLFGGLNPWVYQLFLQNWQNGTIYWLATPEAVFPPLIRTPEPQFTLAVLSVVVWWSLKKRSFWWLYLVLPFLYPFIAVPCGFVVLSLHLRQLIPAMRLRPWLPPVTAFLMLATAMAAYHALLLPDKMEMFMVATCEPMLSFTAVVCLSIFALGYHFCEPRFRYFVGIVAMAPLVTVNLQLISGRLTQPNGFEQYFGIVCAACVMVFSFDRRSGRYLLFATSLLLALFSAHREFAINRAYNNRVTLSKELLGALRTNSENVVVDNTVLASRLNMLYPRQPATRFGFERSLPALCNDEQVREYLRAKRAIQNRPELAGAYTTVFKTLDSAYTYESADFFLLHVGRKTEFQVRHKIELPANDTTTPQLYVARSAPMPPVVTSVILLHSLVVCVASIALCPFWWFLSERYRALVKRKDASFKQPGENISATKSLWYRSPL